MHTRPLHRVTSHIEYVLFREHVLCRQFRMHTRPLHRVMTHIKHVLSREHFLFRQFRMHTRPLHRVMLHSELVLFRDHVLFRRFRIHCWRELVLCVPRFIHKWDQKSYEVATISRLLKIISLSAEYRLFYRALVQKRPTIFKSLLIEATP